MIKTYSFHSVALSGKNVMRLDMVIEQLLRMEDCFLQNLELTITGETSEEH